MTNKEIEEMITAALLSGKGKLIPVSELGMDPSGFTVDENYLYDELYESYVAMCHDKNADDASKATEEITSGYKKGEFAVYGQRGKFKWFSLAAKYQTEIHVMNNEKIEMNTFYSTLQNEGGYSLGQKLAKAINNCDFFRKQLRSCVVVNSAKFFGIDTTTQDVIVMTYFLENFFGQKVKDLVHEGSDGKMRIKAEEVRGKDVILAYGYFTETALNYFVRIAKKTLIEQCGANTVTAIGLCRFVPSITGEHGKIFQEDLLPLITPKPLIELSRMY